MAAMSIVRFRSLPSIRSASAWLIAAILAISIRPTVVTAVPANPLPFEVEQPDGAVVTLHARGGWAFSWLEDTEGYAVVKIGEEYRYAELDEWDELAPTLFRVGEVNPDDVGLVRRQLPKCAGHGCTPAWGATDYPPPNAGIPDQSPLGELRRPGQTFASDLRGVSPTGTVKNLVILCKFSDHSIPTHGHVQADYDVIFNNSGPDALCPTGSVRDVYLENSYNTMTLVSTITAWVTLPQPESYYAGTTAGNGSYPANSQGMVRDALEAADALVDFSQFDTDSDGYVDAIDIIHSGYGAEYGGIMTRIWSHKWQLHQVSGTGWTSDEGTKVYKYHTEPALTGSSGSTIVSIGVIAHETGHFFGLPDLYDTDSSNSSGAGSWAMMANSWGFNGDGRYPPHFCAWSKVFLGWVTPTVLSTSGTYTAPRVQTTPTVFKITNNFPANEYLLIENRQPYGFESVMPAGGLAIWHVDDNKGSIASNNVNDDEGYPGQSGWPTNGRHYRVALLQADGLYDLEKGTDNGDAGDLYRSGGVATIDSTTTPNTKAYAGGTLIDTENTVTNISASGNSMTFQYAPAPQVIESAVMTDPANDGDTLDGSSHTFQWSAGSGITQYFLWVGTTSGGSDLYEASTGTTQSATISGLPGAGESVYVRLWSRSSNGWDFTDYTYDGSGDGGLAAMTDPANNGDTLDGAAHTFQWNAGDGPTYYALWVGTSLGAFNIHDGLATKNRSATVTGLPGAGSTVYVRLWSRNGLNWDYRDYAYDGAGAGGLAGMTSPANDGDSLAGASHTFQWNAGTGPTWYVLWVGRSVGGYDIYHSGATQNLSAAVHGLPGVGNTVYVRLWSRNGFYWDYEDYQYAGAGAGGVAAMTDPANDGDPVDGVSHTFQWSAGTGKDRYALWIGTSVGGSNIHNSGGTTNQSATVNGLPAAGNTVYVRLWSRTGFFWDYVDYAYPGAGTGGLAAMTDPANPGDALDGPSHTFQWSAGTGKDRYALWVGTSVGGYNLYNGQTTGLSLTVNNLPGAGNNVFVRLWSRKGTYWDYTDYVYSGAN
jgi:M6 family metalloprotease-like protein